MILLLILLALFTSSVLLVSKRNKEALLTFSLCLSLLILWGGTLMYIAKKGGISTEIQLFLFLTAGIKTKLQYAMWTLAQLGYTVAIGRYLFPAVLLQLSLHYSMHPAIRAKMRWSWLIYPIPCAYLFFYLPSVFEEIAKDNRTMRLLVTSARVWIVGYILLSVALLLFEYRQITLDFCKRQFMGKMIMLFSLIVLYLLYSQQDPAQIYLFYRNEYMQLLGLWYLSPYLSLRNYTLILIAATICSIIGFTSLIRYTQSNMRDEQDDIVLRRKFDAASAGVSVFVHSIKNQLLANQVLYRRINATCQSQNAEIAAIHRDILLLQENNATMLSHMEELYKSVKTKSIRLQPTALFAVVQLAVDKFLKKYPEGTVQVSVAKEVVVLADSVRLAESIYNLLVNAWEATLESENAGQPIAISLHKERAYTVLEVADKGCGIPRNQLHKVFEPFYSSKNSNYNWGMGMYYVREIVKNHFGSIRIESQQGKGTQIYLLLPRYDARAQKRRRYA